jgi:hypothetical protein
MKTHLVNIIFSYSRAIEHSKKQNTESSINVQQV